MCADGVGDDLHEDQRRPAPLHGGAVDVHGLDRGDLHAGADGADDGERGGGERRIGAAGKEVAAEAPEAVERWHPGLPWQDRVAGPRGARCSTIMYSKFSRPILLV